jgi:hypothetical protein
VNNDPEGDGKRRRGQSGIGEFVTELQRALAMNAAREDAIAASLAELPAGAVPDGWQFADVTPELIRNHVGRAEAILREHVEIVHESDTSMELNVPGAVGAALDELGRDTLRGTMIEQMLHRLNASWSYVDIVAWKPLIVPDEAPLLYLLTLPLGKAHKKHQLFGEAHNLSGVHFHYARLDGKRSDILFAFGQDPPDRLYPIKWERHGTNKAKFFPKPETWNVAKRENVNAVCCAARDRMADDTRFFTPSKQARFLLPI